MCRQHCQHAPRRATRPMTVRLRVVGRSTGTVTLGPGTGVAAFTAARADLSQTPSLARHQGGGRSTERCEPLNQLAAASISADGLPPRRSSAPSGSGRAFRGSRRAFLDPLPKTRSSDAAARRANRSSVQSHRQERLVEGRVRGSRRSSTTATSFGASHRSGAHRIQRDVPDHLVQVSSSTISRRRTVAGRGGLSAHAAGCPVRVRAVQPLHALGDVRLGRLDQQVVVVGIRQ